ncbi:PilZ domain-containing protein [Geomonas sp. RF6]|uniref:PilZ domain-containing protein n=1 Tax=Geomonas sp. RF6 TaxID=2897342 RepID=UPI001E413702|nr:PilZ domain-containing protein [Geomonas sp. RF6]UFS70057.1 PilZ domain-containing protein [Geomonas sp. RF6]
MEPMESARRVLQLVRPGSLIDFPQESDKELSREKLINRLNYINFQDGTLLVNFRHSRFSQVVSLEAKPLPCQDDWLDCAWIDPAEVPHKTKGTTFENLFIIDGSKLVVVEPTVTGMSEKGISFRLPETCREVSYRKVRRHLCDGVEARLIQNGVLFDGTLLDFSAVAFRIEVSAKRPQRFEWVNPEAPVSIIFSRDGLTLYSAECRIISESFGQKARTYVLSPTTSQMSRFRAKEMRAIREELVPLPNIIFRHPFSNKITDLKVLDLSGSGFAVCEDEETSVLMPGMMIPDVELNIANSFSARCVVQVVYRSVQKSGTDESWVKCGLSLLDMDVNDHVRLLALLYLAKDRNSYLCNKVNLDDLWQFFFETGFIYPKKYAFVQANKEKLKETYHRLYTEHPSIARHFLYQERGAILGHMAMLRFHKNSWLIHHHAANRSESNNAGLVVLNQLARSINDSHNLYSAHMSFVVCYYRPENKFPNRVFGTAARLIKDQKGCSIDTFAYLHYQRGTLGGGTFSRGWSLAKAQPADLMELEVFYEHSSGGLMLHALHLDADTLDCDELTREYRQLGFQMERHIYALKKDGVLKAVVLINLSDMGLNLSDLTNCIHIIVLEGDELGTEVLNQVLGILTVKYEQNELPILIYPTTYADAKGVSYEKQYVLWALNISHSGADFYKYMTQLLTRSGKKKLP